MTIIQQEVRFIGGVQGVGFRYRLKQKAEQLGILGEVKNAGNDQVRAVLCGEDTVVQELVEYCQLMKGANIEKIRVNPQPVGQWKGFSIVYGLR